MLTFYALNDNSKKIDGFIQGIKKKLERWNDKCAQNHREEILRIISQKSKFQSRSMQLSALTSAQTARYQTGYIHSNQYSTPSQRLESRLTSADATTYSLIPNKF